MGANSMRTINLACVSIKYALESSTESVPHEFQSSLHAANHIHFFSRERAVSKASTWSAWVAAPIAVDTYMNVFPSKKR